MVNPTEQEKSSPEPELLVLKLLPACAMTLVLLIRRVLSTKNTQGLPDYALDVVKQSQLNISKTLAELSPTLATVLAENPPPTVQFDADAVVEAISALRVCFVIQGNFKAMACHVAVIGTSISKTRDIESLEVETAMAEMFLEVMEKAPGQQEHIRAARFLLSLSQQLARENILLKHFVPG